MSTSDEKRFLNRIRLALGHAPDRSRDGSHLFPKEPTPEESAILEDRSRRTEDHWNALVQKLKAAALPLNLGVALVPDLPSASSAIAALAEKKEPEWGSQKRLVAWRHPLIDRLDLEASLDRLAIPLHLTEPLSPDAGPSGNRAEREGQLHAITAAYIGVTSADFCLADTATLVLRNRPGQPRAVALIPSIHVAVFTRDQLVGDMKELFALLRWNEKFRGEGLSNYMSFISGPSKTADIEATMVHGAHGPREVYLFVLPDNV